MKINVKETLRHAIEKNSQCNPFYIGMGVESWDFVSVRAGISESELLSDKHLKVLDEMIKEEGVYIDLIPNDDMFFKMNCHDLELCQKLEVNGETLYFNSGKLEAYDAIETLTELLDYESGHYGIVLKEVDGNMEVEYGEIVPSSPAGHCPPEFDSYTEDSFIAELLKNSIIYDED